MNEELIAKAREAKSVEELLALAKENNYPLTEEEAQNYFNQFNATGELSDDELDQVGGGCSTNVEGEEYTVVTNHTKCFNGKFRDGTSFCVVKEPKRKDNFTLRCTWVVPGDEAKCGNCYYLEFKSGTGYCGKSRK